VTSFLLVGRGEQCLPGPTVGSSACVFQSPSGFRFTFTFARAAAAPAGLAAPAAAGARLAVSRSALRRSCRDGAIWSNAEQTQGPSVLAPTMSRVGTGTQLSRTATIDWLPTSVARPGFSNLPFQ
jgi:hypothetical protein